MWRRLYDTAIKLLRMPTSMTGEGGGGGGSGRGISAAATKLQLQQIHRLLTMPSASSFHSVPDTDNTKTSKTDYPTFQTNILRSNIAGANQGVYLQVIHISHLLLPT